MKPTKTRRGQRPFDWIVQHSCQWKDNDGPCSEHIFYKYDSGGYQLAFLVDTSGRNRPLLHIHLGQQSLDLLALLQHSSNWYLPKNKGKGTSVRRRMPRWGPKTGDRCTQHHKLWSTEWYLAQRVPWRSSRVDELWDETPPPWSYLKNLAEHPFHTLKLCSPPSHSTLCISQHQHSHALPWTRKKRWLLVLKQSKLPW